MPEWLKNLLILIAVLIVIAVLWSTIKVIINVLFVVAILAGVVGGGYLLAKKFGLL